MRKDIKVILSEIECPDELKGELSSIEDYVDSRIEFLEHFIIADFRGSVLSKVFIFKTIKFELLGLNPSIQ